MITPPPTTIEKYQVIGSLGAGNFGEVFHVFDRALHAEKAIKVILANNPSEFMQKLEEAQILNKCKHKHIVSINEANIFPVNKSKMVVLDLEYIAEGSLESALSSRWVSAKETITYIRGALLGLEHAHSQGFLHRDVKPGNILLSPNAPKLSDFGLATDTGSHLVGSAKGYRPHLPPEYYASGATSELTDVYASGVTLFRSLSNISDWRAVINAVPNLAKHMQDGTLLNRLGYEEYIPDSLKRILRKASHPEPSKRYGSAQAFGQKLDSLRFNIDWVQLSDTEWQGYCQTGSLYKCTADMNKMTITVTRNGRKVTADCRKCSTLSETVSFMHKHIAATTLI